MIDRLINLPVIGVPIGYVVSLVEIGGLIAVGCLQTIHVPLPAAVVKWADDHSMRDN